MTEDYVSYELAVKLKAGGFDEPCDRYWYGPYTNSDEMEMRQGETMDYNNDDWYIPHCSVPTLAHAQKWLREKRKMHCQVLLNGVRLMYFWQVREMIGNGRYADSTHQYDVYEDAMSDCISAALELIKKGE